MLRKQWAKTLYPANTGSGLGQQSAQPRTVNPPVLRLIFHTSAMLATSQQRSPFRTPRVCIAGSSPADSTRTT